MLDLTWGGEGWSADIIVILMWLVNSVLTRCVVSSRWSIYRSWLSSSDLSLHRIDVMRVEHFSLDFTFSVAIFEVLFE